MSVSKKKTVLLAALLTAILLAACGNGSKIRIGTAGKGGNYFAFGQAFSQVLAGGDYKLNTEVRETAGSAANLRLLSQNYIQLALAQSDVIDEMYNGSGDNAARGYSVVAGLYLEPVQVVVRADSGITSFSDLAGRTVSIGEETSGTERNAQQLLEVCGLTDRMLTKKNMTYTEAAEALKNGEIDAMFCTAGAPTQVISELAQAVPVRLLEPDEDTLRLLTGAYEFYSVTSIPAGTYAGQDKPATCVAVQSVLVAADSLSKDKVYTLTKALFEQWDSLNAALPVDYSLDVQSALPSVKIPVHPGAAQYYEECGVAVTEQEGD